MLDKDGMKSDSIGKKGDKDIVNNDDIKMKNENNKEKENVTIMNDECKVIDIEVEKEYNDEHNNKKVEEEDEDDDEEWNIRSEMASAWRASCVDEVDVEVEAEGGLVKGERKENSEIASSRINFKGNSENNDDSNNNDDEKDKKKERSIGLDGGKKGGQEQKNGQGQGQGQGQENGQGQGQGQDLRGIVLDAVMLGAPICSTVRTRRRRG